MVSPPPLEPVIRAIEAHLASHTHAADSADGVARWWVGAGGVQAGPTQIEQALAVLVQRGVLRRVTLADGTVLYSRAAHPTQ